MSEQQPAREKIAVKDRREPFVESPVTQLWQELPSEENPFIAASHLCSGYDVLALAENVSFVDMFYLLFRRELPTPEQRRLLERLMIGLINPGPRHPAARAGVAAGVGKTCIEHILPIGTLVAGGEKNGATLIPDAMKFIRRACKKPAHEVAAQLFVGAAEAGDDVSVLDFSVATPGFGQRFGGVEVYLDTLASMLDRHHGADNPCLHWGVEFARALQPHRAGWLVSGLVAAVLGDLGFLPKQAVGIYQLLVAPGILAHGLEFSGKPRTAWPFVNDENYFIERDE